MILQSCILPSDATLRSGQEAQSPKSEVRQLCRKSSRTQIIGLSSVRYSHFHSPMCDMITRAVARRATPAHPCTAYSFLETTTPVPILPSSALSAPPRAYERIYLRMFFRFSLKMTRLECYRFHCFRQLRCEKCVKRVKSFCYAVTTRRGCLNQSMDFGTSRLCFGEGSGVADTSGGSGLLSIKRRSPRQFSGSTALVRIVAHGVSVSVTGIYAS